MSYGYPDGCTASVVDQLLRERDTLVRRIRILALGLDLIGEVSQMLWEHTGIRGPMEMHELEDLHWVCGELTKLVHPGEYVYEGEASFDRIRRATPEMLRAVIMVGEAAGYAFSALTCRRELARRGLPE